MFFKWLDEGTYVNVSEDLLYPPLQPQLRAKLEDWAFSRRRHMHEVNTRRCWRRPMYGTDLVRVVQAVCHYTPSSLTQKRPGSGSSSVPWSWSWSGYAACALHQSRGTHWSTRSEALREMLCGYEERAALLEETIQRSVGGGGRAEVCVGVVRVCTFAYINVHVLEDKMF